MVHQAGGDALALAPEALRLPLGHPAQLLRQPVAVVEGVGRLDEGDPSAGSQPIHAGLLPEDLPEHSLAGVVLKAPDEGGRIVYRQPTADDRRHVVAPQHDRSEEVGAAHLPLDLPEGIIRRPLRGAVKLSREGPVLLKVVTHPLHHLPEAIPVGVDDRQPVVALGHAGDIKGEALRLHPLLALPAVEAILCQVDGSIVPRLGGRGEVGLLALGRDKR